MIRTLALLAIVAGCFGVAATHIHEPRVGAAYLLLAVVNVLLAI